jgi:hypothetical protein
MVAPAGAVSGTDVQSHTFEPTEATGRAREESGAVQTACATTSAEAANAERPPEPCAQVRILPRAPHHPGSDLGVFPGHRVARDCPRATLLPRLLPFATGRAREELRASTTIRSRVVEYAASISRRAAGRTHAAADDPPPGKPGSATATSSTAPAADRSASGTADRQARARARRSTTAAVPPAAAGSAPCGRRSSARPARPSRRPPRRPRCSIDIGTAVGPQRPAQVGPNASRRRRRRGGQSCRCSEDPQPTFRSAHNP